MLSEKEIKEIGKLSDRTWSEAEKECFLEWYNPKYENFFEVVIERATCEFCKDKLSVLSVSKRMCNCGKKMLQPCFLAGKEK